MPRRSITPNDRVARFDIDELFFSTTDRNGRIRTCNDVFLRISAFPPDEIIGQAHSVVRHPDMPRAVFDLFWEYLLADRPVGAYVKNITADGASYWVYAVALPIDGGFISLRLKPTSPTRAKVEALYSELKEIESECPKDKRAGIQKARRRLDEAVHELGHGDYAQFMASALREEVAARNLALGRDDRHLTRGPRAAFRDLHLLDTLAEEAARQAAHFEATARETHRIALNSSVCAARFNEEGAALGVLSNQIAVLSDEIAEQAAALQTASTNLGPVFESLALQVSLSMLLSEGLDALDRSLDETELSEDQQRPMFGATIEDLATSLQRVLIRSLQDSGAASEDLAGTLLRFDDICERFRKVLLTTRIHHVSGRATAAMLEGGQQYVLLLDQMAATSETTSEALDSLRTHIGRLSAASSSWDLLAAAARAGRALRSRERVVA